MKAYYPWRVMFINGEYKANGIEGYTFPYPLDGKAAFVDSLIKH